MAQWAKVFPSAADKIFVSQADSDSPTGFGLVEKSVSEVKTLLGLPSKVYKAFVNCSSTSNPTVTVIKNTLTSDIAWTRDDTGTYTLAVTSEGSPSGEFTSNKTIALCNAKFSDFTIGVFLATSSIGFYTYNASGDLADSLDFYVSIEVY